MFIRRSSLMKNAAHPVGCVAKNGGDAPEKSTLILEFYFTINISTLQRSEAPEY